MGTDDGVKWRPVDSSGSAWMKRRMPAMYSFTAHWLQLERDRRRLCEPERTMCSYVWQEVQRGFHAQLNWSGAHGMAMWLTTCSTTGSSYSSVGGAPLLRLQRRLT